MPLRLMSIGDIKQERRAAGHTVKHAKWPADERGQPVNYRALITTAHGPATVLQKFVLDVAEGREEVPLLYTPIYRRVANDTLPRVVDFDFTVMAQSVFLRRFEGGEARLGDMLPGSPATVPLATYSSMFEWTREAEMWNELWRIEEFNASWGESYNAFLNHIHLSPILTYAYTAANQTPADATAGADLLTRTRNTLIAAIREAALANRPGSVLLAATANRYQLLDAISRRYDNVGNVLPGIEDIETIIFYDGYALTVGEKSYSYPGVTAGTAYLIRPNRNGFIELVRTHGGNDLDIQRDDQPDVSRGIAMQMVAHTDRGLYSDIASNIEEIALPV